MHTGRQTVYSSVAVRVSVCMACFAKHNVRLPRSCTVGDFTFWISLSLSLFAQSKIRTERKLNQKVKSIFLFGLRPNFGLSEKTELIVWFGLKFGLSPKLITELFGLSPQEYTTDRLIRYRLTFAERKTTSLFRLVQTNRIAKKSPRRNNY